MMANRTPGIEQDHRSCCCYFSLSMCEWVRESLLYTSCLFSPKSSLLPSQRCWVGPATTPPNFFPTTKKFRKRSVQRPSNADANANDVAHFWRMRIGEKVISIRSRPVQPQRRPTSVMTLYRIQRHKERFSIERENHSKQICQWFVDLYLSLSLLLSLYCLKWLSYFTISCLILKTIWSKDT